MKKIFLKLSISSFVLSLIMLLNIGFVGAASFSVSSSNSSVAPGGKFTVSISVAGAGQFNVSASNGSVSRSSVWVDGSASVTCTAGQSGTTTITVTAVDVTANDESAVTGSKSANVSIKSTSNSNTSSSNGSSTSSSSNSSSSSSGNSSSSSSNSNNSAGSTSTSSREPEVKKSSEKNLASLTVSSGTLSPKFSSNETSYDVELTSDTETITINAKAKDSKAKVSGTGEKALKIGQNAFEIVVTAEDGSKKSYTINVNVVEVPTSYINVGDTKLGILKSAVDVDVPDGFKETTVTIDDNEVIAWTNDQLTIVYLMDENKNKSFYIFEDGKVVDAYQTITVLGKKYVILSIPSNMVDQDGLISSKVKIGDLQIDGWSFENEKMNNYSVLYLMNDSGDKSLYTYEGTEGTLQKYTAIEEEKDNTLTYVFIGTTVVFAITTAAVGFLYLNFKKKSISAIKDYYERKNQG